MAETLITLSLMLVVLAVLGFLVRAYSQTSSYSLDRDRLGQAQAALLRAVHELQSARSLTTPTSGTASTLVFRRLDASRNLSPARSNDRLPRPLPNPLPSSFSPLANADLVEVRYSIVGEDFVRQVLRGGVTSQQIQSFEMAGFTVQRLSPVRLLLSLSYRDNQQVVRSLSCQAFVTVLAP